MAILVTIAGILGLAIGSFLNVVIYRVPRGESLVRPGSHCPNCGEAVRARHNVPVLGWLLLRGRCADCAEPINLRYPLIELLTGVLFAGTAVLIAHLGLLGALPACLLAGGVVLTVGQQAQRSRTRRPAFAQHLVPGHRSHS